MHDEVLDDEGCLLVLKEVDGSVGHVRIRRVRELSMFGRIVPEFVESRSRFWGMLDTML